MRWPRGITGRRRVNLEIKNKPNGVMRYNTIIVDNYHSPLRGSRTRIDSIRVEKSENLFIYLFS